jgi:hypothetical protein
MHSMNNKKRTARRKVPALGLPRSQRSIVVIDPKSECAAVKLGNLKHTGVGILNPFLVLPQKQNEACATWFRLAARAAVSELQKGSERKAAK